MFVLPFTELIFVSPPPYSVSSYTHIFLLFQEATTVSERRDPTTSPTAVPGPSTSPVQTSADHSSTILATTSVNMSFPYFLSKSAVNRVIECTQMCIFQNHLTVGSLKYQYISDKNSP